MSTIQNIIAGKCPSCGEAYVFKNRNPYNLQHMADMYTRCPHCDKSFQREPGFYFGAMYVSYAITTAFAILSMILFWGILDMATLPLLLIIGGVVLVSFPYTFRLSRMIWLAWFI